MRLMGWVAVAATVLMAGCATAPAPLPQKERAEVANYHAIAVHSVKLAPELAAKLGAEETRSLERQLHIAVVDALPPAARAVTPAPGVMRLEVTVTELDAARPAVNAVTSALVFLPLDKGGIGFEARFYGSTGGELLARTTQHHTSIPLELKGRFSLYGHAVKVMHDCAEDLGKTLAPA